MFDPAPWIIVLCKYRREEETAKAEFPKTNILFRSSNCKILMHMQVVEIFRNFLGKRKDACEQHPAFWDFLSPSLEALHCCGRSTFDVLVVFNCGCSKVAHFREASARPEVSTHRSRCNSFVLDTSINILVKPLVLDTGTTVLDTNTTDTSAAAQFGHKHILFTQQCWFSIRNLW